MALSKGFLINYISRLDQLKLYGDILMLGSQESRITKNDLQYALNTKDIKKDLSGFPDKLSLKNIFNIMGAQSYTDIDLFGEPKIVMDLAEPFPSAMQNKYDFVCDIGTIEHVINPFQALENVVFSLKPGGGCLLFSPANIAINHGYYTLQPQLFSDFFKQRGFRIVFHDLLVYWGKYDKKYFLLYTLPYPESVT